MIQEIYDPQENKIKQIEEIVCSIEVEANGQKHDYLVDFFGNEKTGIRYDEHTAMSVTVGNKVKYLGPNPKNSHESGELVRDLIRINMDKKGIFEGSNYDVTKVTKLVK